MEDVKSVVRVARGWQAWGSQWQEASSGRIENERGLHRQQELG